MIADSYEPGQTYILTTLFLLLLGSLLFQANPLFGSPEKSGGVIRFQIHFPSIFLCLIRPILLFALTQIVNRKVKAAFA
ncbi:hypothetical protein D1164_20115, partial [Mariniphaga sediminis]